MMTHYATTGEDHAPDPDAPPRDDPATLARELAILLTGRDDVLQDMAHRLLALLDPPTPPDAPSLDGFPWTDDEEESPAVQARRELQARIDGYEHTLNTNVLSGEQYSAILVRMANAIVLRDELDAALRGEETDQ